MAEFEKFRYVDSLDGVTIATTVYVSERMHDVKNVPMVKAILHTEEVGRDRASVSMFAFVPSDKVFHKAIRWENIYNPKDWAEFFVYSNTDKTLGKIPVKQVHDSLTVAEAKGLFVELMLLEGIEEMGEWL